MKIIFVIKFLCGRYLPFIYQWRASGCCRGWWWCLRRWWREWCGGTVVAPARIERAGGGAVATAARRVAARRAPGGSMLRAALREPRRPLARRCARTSGPHTHTRLRPSCPATPPYTRLHPLIPAYFPPQSWAICSRARTRCSPAFSPRSPARRRSRGCRPPRSACCCVARLYATQGSNPRLAGRVPSSSATHSLDPRVG